MLIRTVRAVNNGIMWWSLMDEEWLECLHVCKGAWIIDTVTGYWGSLVKLLHRWHQYERPVSSYRAYSSLFSVDFVKICLKVEKVGIMVSVLCRKTPITSRTIFSKRREISDYLFLRFGIIFINISHIDV